MTETLLDKTKQFRHDFRAKVVPKDYSAKTHIIINAGILLFAILVGISLINRPSIFEFSFLFWPLLLGNFVVFFVHKDLLHSKRFGQEAYKIHTLWHHRFYTHEMSTWDDQRDFYILFFPPIIVILFSFIALPLIYALTTWIFSPNAAAFMVIGSAIYFMLYEIFHFASHVPEQHFLMRIKPIAYMRYHHQMHHNPRYMGYWNFNIVYPLADIIFRRNFKNAPEEIIKKTEEDVIWN